jgi:Ca2+-binding EF-hand superfamily protein
MRWILGMLVLMLAGPALAEEALPSALSKRIRADPTGYLNEVSALIAGYGTGGAINRQGLDNVVALARAAARARAWQRLSAVDLDGDDMITPGEVAISAAALGAAARGRLVVAIAAADADHDGTVSAAEMHITAAMAALDGFDEAKAQQLRAILMFDGDGDGQVTLDEVRATLAARVPPKPPIPPQAPKSRKAA